MSELSATAVASAELPVLAGALEQAGLPVDDIAEPGRHFLRFSDPGGSAVGWGGMEIHGANVLLRSVAVAPPRRGSGLGRAIVEHLMAEALELGAARAYVLTTAAQGFFRELGFVVIARHEVPANILATRQASALCPSTAAIMTRVLAG